MSMRTLALTLALAALCGCPEHTAQKLDLRTSPPPPETVASAGRTPAAVVRRPRHAPPPALLQQLIQMDHLARHWTEPVGTAEGVLDRLHRHLHASVDLSPARRPAER